MTKPAIGLVHLVRACNGTAPLETFLESCRKHPAGIEHALVFVLKGFDAGNSGERFDAILNRVPHERLFVPDRGYDITAYFRAARHFEFPFFMFTNSFSEVLVDDWLLKLHRGLQLPNVGLAGATGSWNGFHIEEESKSHSAAISIRSRWKRALIKLPGMEAVNSLKRRFIYPRFPNPHLRTNAFILRRETMLALQPQVTPTKYHAYWFESGSHSMTRQVLAMGKSVVVVGRDGSSHDISEWRGSRIFWEGNQENLMVADNQTRRYQMADQDTKDVFAWHAWGIDRGATRA